MNSELVKQVGDRKARLRLAYLAEQDIFLGVSFDLFCRLFLDWEIKPLLRKDTYIGVVFQKDSEIHVAILPEFRKRWLGKWIGPFLKSLMVDNRLTTRLYEDDVDNLNFDLRLGFKVVGKEGTVIKLLMTYEDYKTVWEK